MKQMPESRSGHGIFWHPCTQMKQLEVLPPLPVASGEGPWLIDCEGRRYLDAISSWWVNLVGHTNPRINAAIVDQLGKIEHVILAGCTHAPVVELSERLAGLTGLGHAFYASDGASAVEITLKMSFHYWRNCGRPEKTGFVSLRNGYHGETLGALSVTDVALFKSTYALLLRPTHQVMTPDWRYADAGESAEDYALRAAADLDAWLAMHGDTTAAVILEPLVQGAAGMGMYAPQYLRKVREACDRHGVHLIADEIAVGFGRTGKMFACEQAPTGVEEVPLPLGEGRVRGVEPREGGIGEALGLPITLSPALPPQGGGRHCRVADIADFVCLSKGITGGYLPMSVVLTRDEVYDAFYDDDLSRGFLHSHSYSGNPLACRAALAVLDIFEQDDVIAANRVKAARMTEMLAPLKTHPRVRHFRHTGMIWAFDVADAPPGFSLEFHRHALEAGVLLRPIGSSVYLMPPYVVKEGEMQFLAEAVAHTLEAVLV